MATLSFQHIDKVYPNKVQAVFDFNLEVKDKEFIAFVGPSGCGKSTTLRMIAGLEDITAGELYIDDRLINGVMPKNRNIAMVFQNYALYPHMSVYDNMAFALKLRKNSLLTVNKLLVKKIKESLKNNENDPTLLKELELFSDVNKIKQLLEEENYLDKLNELSSKYGIPLTKESFYKYRHYNKQEIKERVLQAAEILGITPYLERKPAALSGGQRQRVALGRAIVRSPKVFLMDEPLSNLDAKLRVQMRSEIIKIHKRVNATTIYVTHDQTEAMTMADRIVVMKDGYIQQIGTPKEVYSNPSNMFVAGFIGSPSMNFFNGVIKKDKFIFDGENHVEISLKGIDKSLKEKLKEYEDKEVVLGVRPESIDIDVEGENTIQVNYDISELLGYELLVYGYINNQRITFKTDLSNEKYINSNLKVKFDLSKIAFFDKESTNRI